MKFPVFYSADHFFTTEFQAVEKEYQGHAHGADCVEWHGAVVAAKLRKQVSKPYYAYDCQYKAIDLEFQWFWLTVQR